MTRLFDYIEEYTPLLMEKVNKSEINGMLKNADIYVGAEFEFIAGDAYDPLLDALHDEAVRDWEAYTSELESWSDEKDEWVGDFNDLEETIDNLNDQLEEDESELERLELLDYEEDEDEREELANNIEQYKSEIKEFEVRLNDHENDEPEPPKMGDDYYTYMADTGWMSYNETLDPNDGEPDYPQEPGDGGEGQLDDYQAEEWLDNVHPKPPFGDNYSEGGTVEMGDTEWIVKGDTSLSPGGIEIISPPMPIKDFVKICPKMFKWIDDVGETDSSCGFHIHMSLKSTPDLKKVIDISKLIMFTDEQYIYNFFPERKNNTYVRSVKNAMNRNSKLLNKKELSIDNRITSTHYNSINWEGLSDDHGHIEFRYLGSANYSKKWDKTKTIIAQYAYNLNLACNPDFKWKEYRTKLGRLLNLLEKRQIKKVVTAMNLFAGSDVYIELYTKKGRSYFDGMIKKTAAGKVVGVDWFSHSSIIKYFDSVIDKWKSFSNVDTKEKLAKVDNEMINVLPYLP
jgi:hypothetical protein